MAGSAAIIGAGMAGLACAARLAEAGWRVTPFDKGRGPGGRMASKVVTAQGLCFVFDYGAQYLTARDPGFVAQVEDWGRQGVAARWPAAGDDTWVGMPGMNAVVAHMAAVLDVRWSTHIRTLRRDADGWWLTHDAMTEGPFDAVVLALPAEQTADLAEPSDTALARLARANPSEPCWTVLLGFDTAVSAPDILSAADPIDWAARNGAKPGRGGGEAWTIHATPDWSRRHVESERTSVTASLLRALEERVGTLPVPVHATAHRWRYARSGKAGIGAYHRPDIALAACGDWLIAPRVESAWLSGRQAAEMLLA
ncbi:NAD(P)-binding protein [Sphingomonas sanguinis]|uniref:NAD(P)/FAD-dependent oxidoreductase n=1 Tax=Sphingomonas sanguinis TaxID=33051 RepID=UPI001C580FE4|nr:FAD-dependent oxidoreductase [Sphingomonas sanguinis]QXT34664.1 NAD(P)-binding protein [Sphingomonas sanguinis]